MRRYKRDHYMIAILFALLILPSFMVGCSSLSRTVTTQRDTLYVERIVDRELLVRDTLETTSRVVEYVADSLGEWRPQRMLEEVVVQHHTQKREGEERVKEDTLLKSKTEIVKERPIKREWYMFGVFLVLLFFIFLFIKF